MTPLFVVVEGQSEEAFVRAVLAPHLQTYGVYGTAIIVATKRERDGRKRRGGGDWNKWKADIFRLLRDSREELRVTTLFDLYGLPKSFPGYSTHSAIVDTEVRCKQLESSMAAEIGDPRFIPYLQRHEFEALVLAGLPVLELLLEAHEDRKGYWTLVSELGQTPPEDVNDGEDTAPSKRLAKLIPSYDPGKGGESYGKPFWGELILTETGIPTLKAKCPRFARWVQTLESLGVSNP